MALEKQRVLDKVEVLEDGTLQVRHAVYIVDTDTGERVAGPHYHRSSHAPGEDVSRAEQRVRAVASAVWPGER